MKNNQAEKSNLFYELFIKDLTYKDISDKEYIWREIAKQLNGHFKIKQTVSKDLTSFMLNIPHRNQTIQITETDTKPLKSEVILNLKNQFEFNISLEGGMEKILKLLGSQDIEIGNNEFDNKYMIKTSSPSKAVEILTELKDLILELNIYVINLEQEKSEKHKLIITKDRTTTSLKEMIAFIELNTKLIDSIFKACL